MASRRLPRLRRRIASVSSPAICHGVESQAGRTPEGARLRELDDGQSRLGQLRDVGALGGGATMTPRVAITGVGLVTALGAAREGSWRRMVAGECGIGPMTVFDAEGYRSRIAAQVPMREIDA